MAKIVQAVNKYGPRLDLTPTAQLDEVSEWMAMRTGLNRSEVMMVLQELSELILTFNRRGTPVKLPGVGIFMPAINRDGHIRIYFRADKDLREAINTNNYRGEIINAERIGLDDAGYKALWDAEHPDDPLEV